MATGEALICKLKNITPIAGADNIVQANMFGETVIISKDYKEGDLGLLFDCESLVSEDFARENNLYRHSNLNKDTTKVGYLEDSRRIRAIKLRGVKCSAMFMPIKSLKYIIKDGLYPYPKEGTQITEWQGKPICNKYVRPIKNSGNKNNKQIKRVQKVLNFAEHLDTDQLMRNLHKINIGDKIIVTSKVHGTSARVGLLPVINTKWWSRLLGRFGIELKNKYKMVVGSRHVLKHIDGDRVDKKDSYYEEDIWTKTAYENFKDKLIAGETVFYEIVGFLPNGTPIMPTHNNEKLKNFLEKKEYKEFIDRFGKETVFSYGCTSHLDIEGPQGTHKIFVYRITLTTEFGQSIDLSWEQVKRRCEEMGVNYVPEIQNIYINDTMLEALARDEENWSRVTEMDCKFFPQHLNEGICVRVENCGLRPDIYKNKRYAFKVLEGIIKDSAEFADIEESN